MKRKIIIILMAFSIVLCLSGLFGCSLSDSPDNNEGDTPNPPAPSEITELQAPESIRLDMATDTLYIADCSASGVKYYTVTQIVGINKYDLGSLDASDLKAENGYFAMENVKVRTGSAFKLMIICKAMANDILGASRSFDFECVGGIEDDYNSGKCVFDNDSGLYSWPAVADATGYKIEIHDTDEVTVVQEPKFTVDESLNSFTVTPLYDGNKIGIPCTVSLQGMLITQIKYDTEKRAFVWYGGGSFIAEVTENGQTVTKTGNGEELPYTPASESVSIRITTLSSSHRPGVGPLVTFDVLQNNLDISLDKDTCELSWNGVEGATKYDVKLRLKDDGTVQTVSTEDTSIILNNLNVNGKKIYLKGAASAIITPVTKTPTIALFSPFDFYVIDSLNEIKPEITRAAESGKINVSIPSDKSVASYKITLKETFVETRVVEVDCPIGSVTADAHIELPFDKLYSITVSHGSFRGGEGHYCFSKRFSVREYSKNILYASAPKVSMHEVSKTSYTDEGFLIDVEFPEQLIGKGEFTLKYEYADTSNIIYFKDNKSLSLDAAVGKNALKVYYQSFKVGYESALLFSDSFQTEINCLNVNVTANKNQIEWQSVEGAESYCVEMSDGGAYTAVYEGSETHFAYSLREAGDYSFRVTPCNPDPLIIGVGSVRNIRKLATPAVSINGDSLPLVSSDETDANIVTLLDGENKELTGDILRTALTGKTSVPLIVRCTRSDTDTRVYVDSDDAQYTLHRIAEINDDSMGLTVNNENTSVSWTAADNANNYACRLYRKSADGEFAEISAFSGSQTQMDCTVLTCGEYKLEIKPVNYADGQDLYVYIDEAASGTFAKEGINSVGIGSGGSAFTVDGFMTSASAAKATVKISYMHSNGSWTGNFPISDSIDFSQGSEFTTKFNSVEEITFSIEYDGIDDEHLNRLNTLKGKEFVMSVTTKTCETPDFNGSYSLLDSKDNSDLNKAKVTLTPVFRQLKDFESYSIVYKQKYKEATWGGNYADKVSEISETAGNELIFDVPNISDRKTNLFALRVTSNKFIEENGEIVFYRSSGIKSADESFKVCVSDTLSDAVIYDEKTSVNETDATEVSFKLRTSLLGSSEEYLDYGYLAEDGKWRDSNVKIKDNYYASYVVNFSFFNSTDINIFAGKQLKLRVRRHAMSIDGVNYDASCWYYLSVTVPPIT